MAEINDLVNTCGEWASKVFDKATPESICAHLRKEVLELSEKPYDAEEAADCILLILHLAYKQNWDLQHEIIRKLKINKQRIWGDINVEGFVEHVRE